MFIHRQLLSIGWWEIPAIAQGLGLPLCEPIGKPFAYPVYEHAGTLARATFSPFRLEQVPVGTSAKCGKFESPLKRKCIFTCCFIAPDRLERALTRNLAPDVNVRWQVRPHHRHQRWKSRHRETASVGSDGVCTEWMPRSRKLLNQAERVNNLA